MSPTDNEVLAALVRYFDCEVVHFKSIVQPRPQVEDSGYWHVRLKDRPGVVIVRMDTYRTVHVYGPVKGVVIASLE